MPGIQLNKEAIDTASDDAPKARAGVLLGEKPTDAANSVPEELKDEALSREQVEQFLMEIREQPHWRKEADKCADYYDGNQLDADTIELLKQRGQPPLVTNLIKPTVDTVLGMEAKTRTDWRVNPEDDDLCPDELAEALSIKLKHAEIESRADRAVSDAYAAEIKAGLGWVEVARERDPLKPPYRVDYVHRREIHWDWRSKKPDLSDARYLIRRRWVELDDAVAMMPMYASLFRNTVGAWSGFDPILSDDTGLLSALQTERDTRLSADDWRDTERQRICLYEIWYRKWVRGYIMRLSNGTTMEADFHNQRHAAAIMAGAVQIEEATFQKVRLAWYTGPHFLFDVPSPYNHGKFPYVPFFGYREDTTGAPYGLIRSMVGPQDEINARKSKMLWSLNSRRVIADADAVKDHAVAAQEVARPDAYIILNPSRKPTSEFRVEPGGDLAAQQFQVMQEAKEEIAEASGVHKAMMGQDGRASSGLAINSLVEQGLNTLAEINDNYRFARRLVGEMLFEMVKQRYSTGTHIVKSGQGAKTKIIKLNVPGIDEATGQQTIMNNVASVRAKVVLDDIPSTPTYRMQQLQMLSEIVKSLPPELQGLMVDHVIESTDLPQRHELADRLRSAIGVKDPKQQQAEAQAAAAAQAAATDQQNKLMVLEAAEKAARIRKTSAEADRAAIEADNARLNGFNQMSPEGK